MKVSLLFLQRGIVTSLLSLPPLTGFLRRRSPTFQLDLGIESLDKVYPLYVVGLYHDLSINTHALAVPPV